jgi:transcription elongation factor GreA
VKFPMTPRCYERMKEELRACKADRPRVAADILEAREKGDLSENAEYHAAKDKQGMLEARIRGLEAKIGQAEVIDPAKLSGVKVVFGATVRVADSESGDEQEFTIVGEDESDVKQGLISITSPMARALLNHEQGEEVQVRTPKGGRSYEIVKVAFRPLDATPASPSASNS